MERLTDPAQGYCEMYCKKYGHCFGDPGDCIFKQEIAMYEALKSIEGIVPFDRLLKLAKAEQDGRLVVLPCKENDEVYVLLIGRVLPFEVTSVNLDGRGKPLFRSMHGLRLIYAFRIEDIGETVFLTREEAEAALEGGKDGA